jgi:hypothetical protein
MPDDNTEAGRKLKMLGERLRAGFAKRHPARHLETVRGAVREQWEAEQQAKRTKTVKPPLKSKDKEQGIEPAD